VKSSYINNPHDVTPTTNREMEELYRQNLWTVNSSLLQSGAGYATTGADAVNTMRNQTINEGRSNYIGGGSSANKYGDTHDTFYQTSNGIKDSVISGSGYSPAGNMSMFNSDINTFSDPRRQNMMMEMGQFQNAPKTFNQLAPGKELIGRQNGGEFLYEGIQMDRNTNETMGEILKQNPYAIRSLSSI
jgi:hypothetical protein